MASRAQGETARILHFPDLKPARRKELLGQEIGTSFDYGQRLFAFYGSGDVFDYGEWSARDMKNMLRRDGQCSAIELVLTLPIREADRDIVPAKGDKGETDLVKSVLMAADHEGGIQTPIEDVIGQTTSGQIYRKAHFETTWKIRDSDGKIVYDKIAYRPPATCQSRYDERTGAPNGFRQQVWLFGGNLALTKGQKTPGYVDIPKIRSAIYVHGKHREPLVGISEMDIAYWPWAHGTRVPTPDGWTVIEGIQPGDQVFGVDGQPLRVTAVHPQGRRQMYRVTLRDGTSAECSADHLWGVHDAQRGNRYRVMHTHQIISAGLRRSTAKSLWRFSVPLCQPAEYPERDLPVDPYVLGAWLGDGSMQRAADGERRYGPRLAAQAYGGWVAGEVATRLPADMKLSRSGDDYLFVPVVSRDTNPFRDALVAMGVSKPSGERFIPDLYLQASVKQRLDLLRGLMDTDGSAEGGNHARFHTTSPQLAAGVRELARSLGGTAIIREVRGKLRTEIRLDECPFLLPAKASRWQKGSRYRQSAIVSIEPTMEQECRCITVDRPDGLFLVNDYLTGHNCYQTKMKLLYLWYNFLENLAMQRIIVYGNDEPEAEARAADVAALKGAGVVGLPHPESGQKAFDTIEAGDAGSMFKDAMGFLESWQIGSVLAGFMGLTGAATGGRGSYALSQDQSSFYLKSRQAVAKEIAGFFTHQIIRPLVVVNFGPGAAIPSWKFGPLQDEQIQALLTLFGQIVAAPALHIPIEFVDLLAERMASVLQLDVDVVHQALAASAAQRAQQLMAGPAAQQAAAGGMPPTAIQGIGQLAGVANAGLSIARQATAPGRGGPPQALPTQQLAARQAAAGPPRPGAGLRPQAGPPTPPAKPPMTPPPGRMA